MMITRVAVPMEADGDVTSLIGTEMEVTPFQGRPTVGVVDDATPTYDEDGTLTGAVLLVRLP